MSRKGRRRRIKLEETVTYPLEEIHGILIRDIPVTMTRRALSDSQDLQYMIPDIKRVIGDLRPGHFQNSMPSDWDALVRQDVYKIVDYGVRLYIKFQRGPDGKLMLLSFHEDR